MNPPAISSTENRSWVGPIMVFSIGVPDRIEDVFYRVMDGRPSSQLKMDMNPETDMDSSRNRSKLQIPLHTLLLVTAIVAILFALL